MSAPAADLAPDPHYPLGTLAAALAAPPRDFPDCVWTIARFPEEVRNAVEGLSPKQLRRRYRPGSWTVRQVVHHCADSHQHAMMRVKWALTAPAGVVPEVAGYDEAACAELPDYGLPLAPTLRLLDGLHAHFAALLDGLDERQRARTYFHTGHGRAFSVAQTAVMYDWHCRHHLAHVRIALGKRVRPSWRAH